MNFENRLKIALERIKTDGNYRTLRYEENEKILDFSSNDYLSLKYDPRLVDAFCTSLKKHGVGSCSSRLVGGSLDIHKELEESLAAFLNFENALLFSSGYLANFGLLSTLCSKSDLLVLDKLSHASLIDGAQSSKATLSRFAHNDIDSLKSILEKSSDKYENIFIITESVFSMDGDIAPINEIVKLSNTYGTKVIVDESHAFGVFGGGRGLCYQLGLSDQVFAITATLSKSFGSYGGVVFCSNLVREYLINRARSFIYNTSLPHAICSASSQALNLIQDNHSYTEELLEKSKYLYEELKAEFSSEYLPPSFSSQIIPFILKDSKLTYQVFCEMKKHGIYTYAFRPPTVPKGSARLRLSVNRAHTYDNLDFLIKTLSNVLGKFLKS